MWLHARPADQPTESATMSAGKHPSTSPAGLGRVPLLLSGRHTRGVHESAGRGFALTQHAHIVIIAVLYTRTTVALALPQALSHKRSSPFQGPTAACACPKSPPQGCRIPILGRSVITYFRYADTYAGRPRLSSLVSRRVRMPTALSVSVSNVPYNHPNHTISTPTPNPVPKSHHPGRLESCSPPSAVSHPLGRRPLTPPLDS